MEELCKTIFVYMKSAFFGVMNEQFNLFHYILYSIVLSHCISHRDSFNYN
jgi:hypothetical protein